MAKSYVKSLTVATSGKSSSFEFATPDDFMRPTGAINVICGENGAGKSFLIRALDGLVSDEGRKAMYSGYTLETTLAEVQPAIVRIEPWNNLSFAGQIFFDRRSDYTQSRDEKRLIPLRFWVDLIQAYRSNVGGDPLNEAEWLASYDHRKTVFETIQLSHVLPLATFLEKDLILAFEEMFDCQLGLRVKSQTLELTMDNDFGLFPFQNWSQGQKTIFNTLQIMHYSDASVFLFDEIENNLHPASISKLMRRMKLSKGSQFIITSHHPHVIFSKFADRSLFIERVKPARSRRGVSYENEGKKASIHRRVFSLEKATEKFRATYQLFDSSDVELLEQASSVRSALEARIYTDIFQNIGFQVVAEKPGPFADNQTMHMVETMKGLDAGFGEIVTVLDYGSGLCRVAHEFGKIYQQPGKRKFRWIFWEPNVAARLAAQETMPESDNFIFLESV